MGREVGFKLVVNDVELYVDYRCGSFMGENENFDNVVGSLISYDNDSDYRAELSKANLESLLFALKDDRDEKQGYINEHLSNIDTVMKMNLCGAEAFEAAEDSIAQARRSIKEYEIEIQSNEAFADSIALLINMMELNDSLKVVMYDSF